MDLNKYEELRKKDVKIAYIYLLISVIGFVIFLLFLILNLAIGWNEYLFSFLAIGLIVFLVFIVLFGSKVSLWHARKKYDFVKYFFSSYDDLSYKMISEEFDNNTLDKALAFPKRKTCDYSDFISGKYNDVTFTFSKAYVYNVMPIINLTFAKGTLFSVKLGGDKVPNFVLVTNDMKISGDLALAKKEINDLVLYSDAALENEDISSYLDLARSIKENYHKELFIAVNENELFVFIKDLYKLIGTIPYLSPLKDELKEAYVQIATLPSQIIDTLKIQPVLEEEIPEKEEQISENNEKQE